jgi:4-hydroxythreonine-4-phosphate dehydrogenase
MTLPLAVSMGDPAGVGAELLLKAWAKRGAGTVPPFAAFADPDWLRAEAARSAPEIPIREIADASAASAVFAEALPVIPVPLARPATPGRPDPENAAAVIASIERSVEAVRSGNASAVVTLPIAKHVLQSAGFAHPGHTEFLGELARRFWGVPATPLMMLAGPELRTVPLTVHCPLSEVPGRIDGQSLQEAVRILAQALKQDFGIAAPRIAVAGLNPHAGESGRLGPEDDGILRPAVEALAAEGLAVSGPHPADTLFAPHMRPTYDAAVCMYHDQALIPVKALAFDETVNVTLGLPFVRTSPDHGTAFDIAGKGAAKPDSVLAALRMAAEMARARAASGP